MSAQRRRLRRYLTNRVTTTLWRFGHICWQECRRPSRNQSPPFSPLITTPLFLDHDEGPKLTHDELAASTTCAITGQFSMSHFFLNHSAIHVAYSSVGKPQYLYVQSNSALRRILALSSGLLFTIRAISSIYPILHSQFSSRYSFFLSLL